ncbi:hypothetical protein EMPS_07717 [Entomortierella parvispora]|uniref:Uncharacterized protein n=1 Tax=Entomortierella parvispora TaxID=205924 RepID=A0A9P3HET6_9FUNG|nr:hypothetical protein EMPS_07717 [Entomortierella parvispora]
MTSKRSFQQREDEPWLAYPNSQSRGYSRSSTSIPHHDLHGQTVVSPPLPPHTASSWTTPVNHKRSISKLDPLSSSSSSSSTTTTTTTTAAPPSSTFSSTYSRGGYESLFSRSSISPSFFGSRHRSLPPKTLSEELSMALQNPENSYPSPVATPSALLSSPADLSSSASQSPTCSLSPSTAASTHFPLFKQPSIPSSQQSNNNDSGGQRLRPSPLSLHPSNSSSLQYRSPNGAGGSLASPSSPFRSGSPTSALTRDSTTASDVAGSPRAASQAVAASLGRASPTKWSRASPKGPPQHRLSASMFSDSAMSSFETENFSFSPRRAKAVSCSPLCQSEAHGQPQQHHPSCTYSHHPIASPELRMSIIHHGPKPGRATKGIHRFGFPQFRPEIDETHPGSDDPMALAVATAKTRTTSTSTGYGMPRGRRHEDDIDMDDDEDLGGLGRTYASEPPKKRMRSTASMLLDAAVETVIFTGAVALSAYQLLTGKGKLGTGNSNSSNPTSGSNSAHHSKQASSASSLDADTQSRDDMSKALDEDPMEEKLALKMDVSSNSTPRSLRTYGSSGTLGRSGRNGAPVYHRAKTPRSYRSRPSFSSSGGFHQSNHSGHARSPSMPVRPNTGTEDSDEAFLRMEAQLNSLIAEGKRALSSRIEVWDEE